MIQRIVGWVTGCLGFIASVIAISAALGNAPLKVVGDIEFHATAWVLLATVFFGVCCGLTVPPLVNRCWTAPRRARAARFQELLLEIKALRSYYDQHDSGRGAGGRDALNQMMDLDAKLRRLGIGFFGRSGRPDFSTLIDMAERAAVSEAKRQFPLHSSRPVADRRT